MKMKRLPVIALAALCLLGIAFSLAGCNGSAGDAPVGSSAPTETVTTPLPIPSETKNTQDGGAFNFADLNGWVFWFGSGAGGWRTTLEVSADGTFSGSYTDSEMGSTGEDYPNGIVYVCNFTGKFTSVKKVGDYEYSLQCESLSQEGKEGDEEIADGIKYITSTPYGLDNAGEFRLYLPGKKVSELPAGYLDWVKFAIDDSDELAFYGLYNIAGEQGFSSDDSNALPDVSGTDDVYPETLLTFDSEGFEQVSHNMYSINGMLFVTLEAEPLAETLYGEESILARIKELEGADLRELRASESEEISARLTFPAWLVYYEKGENEDTRFCIDLYFQSNRAEYRVHIEVAADAAAEYEDVYERVLNTVEVRDV